MWLAQLFGRRARRPAAPPPSFAESQAPGGRRGFAEDLAGRDRPGGLHRGLGQHEFGPAPRFSLADTAGLSEGRLPRRPGRPEREGAGTPFSSTGPQGHRGRMRQKLLERGPDALADYELLEMLLFFAFKTGDTKPLAKSLINRYGSFAAVLAAP